MITLAEHLVKLCVYDPRTDLWYRVRQHQLQDCHIAYWDDDRYAWVPLPGKEPELAKLLGSDWEPRANGAYRFRIAEAP